MPGQGSDAPAWVVLRDPAGAISGVVDLSMVQSYRAAGGMETEWATDRVVVHLAAQFPLRPASGPAARWLRARTWVWRTLLGLAPTEDMFR